MTVTETRVADTAAPADPDPNPAAKRVGHGLEHLATVCLVLIAMATLATIGFRTMFPSYAFLTTSVAGAALGAIVTLAGRRFGLLVGEWTGLAVVVPLVLGPLCTGGLDFYSGLVHGWADLLTAEPPVDASPALRAVPFVAAYAGSAIGAGLAHYRDLPGLGVIGPLATLAVTALVSEQTRTGALIVGVTLLVGLLLLTRLHQTQVSQTGLVVLGFVLALVGVVASTSSLVLGLADEDSRVDLRELQTPPWDPLQAPSPLADVKASLLRNATAEDRALFRISGSRPIDRWRIAALPVYDGITWGVAEPQSPAEFIPIDTELPVVAGTDPAADQVRFDVEVLTPIGPWLPTPGIATRLDIGDVDARMSLETGTIGVPVGLQTGDTYSISAASWATPDDAEVRATTFAVDDRRTELEQLPAVIRNLSADFTTGLGQLSGDRVLAIRDNLRLGSYDLEAAPGHSFARIAEFLQVVDASSEGLVGSDLRALVGHEELYAAAGGVLVRLSDIPARVAVGYLIPDDRWVGTAAEVRPSDISAWLEVQIPGHGWTPIDVTPERSRDPEPVDQGEREEQGVPFANPPLAPETGDDSPAPEELDDEDELEPEEPEVDDEVDSTAGRPVLAAAVAAAAVPAVALMIAALGVVVVKAVRRRRRRSGEATERVFGAWNEFTDRLDEAGDRRPRNATPAEIAAWSRELPGFNDHEMGRELRELADHVTVASFHPDGAPAGAADRTWEIYQHAHEVLRANTSTVASLRRSIDPRPLVGTGRRQR